MHISELTQTHAHVYKRDYIYYTYKDIYFKDLVYKSWSTASKKSVVRLEGSTPSHRSCKLPTMWQNFFFLRKPEFGLRDSVVIAE
jgi:hypothetical protein